MQLRQGLGAAELVVPQQRRRPPLRAPAPRPGARRAPPPPAASAAASAAPDAPPTPTLPVFSGKVDWTVMYKQVLQASRDLKVDAFWFQGPRNVALRHPDDVALVCRDSDCFTKGDGMQRIHAWLGDGLVATADAALHDGMRELLIPAFVAAAVKGFAPDFAKVGEEVADVLELMDGREYDIERLCRRATLDVIGRAGFGHDFQGVKFAAAEARGEAAAGRGSPSEGAIGDGFVDVISVFDALLLPAFMLLARPLEPEANIPGIEGYHRSIRLLDDVIERMVEVRRSRGISPGDNSLLSHMLRAQQAGNGMVTDKQMRDQLQTFFFAGSDTTATTLCFALYQLSRHPEVLEACLEEVDSIMGDAPSDSLSSEDYGRMKLLAGVANETLRMFPAAPSVSRRCAQDVTIRGHAIPAGTRVVVSLYGMQRHEDYWPRPDEWLPERWLPANAPTMAPHADKAFMPFTVGPRACIGKYFALIELQVLLAVILRRIAPGPAAGRGELDTWQNLTLCAAGGAPIVPRRRRRRA
ncbi:cytochrome P450 [Raphidocelis subcapitata]|uniref:Cytochrome P450 n=1 Tax=Raphidocelis subcapitata TaxID=307507 RepID=A0A2V0NXU5_9CHLO|nr:cytochrome P450 [Raphidocelis subcapitata]|eukprot:GBF90393.1 cytochrome P450 [Raphidocelis subcapitata]